MKLMPSAAPSNDIRSESPAQDEWGMFDPQRAGMAAAWRVLNDSPEPPLPAPPAAPTVDLAPHIAPAESQVGDAGGALYQVESPLRCPQCQSAIRTFRALRVLRTRVPFMSTLPRKGYVLVCPECAGLLSAELSGLL